MSADTGDISPDSGPNVAYHRFRLPVPRDPSCYAPTDHFKQRRKYRADPSVKDWIVEECIQEGFIHGTNAENRYRFEKRLWSEGTHLWHVIVAIDPAAYYRDERTHSVLTAYADAHGEVAV